MQGGKKEICKVERLRIRLYFFACGKCLKKEMGIVCSRKPDMKRTGGRKM